MKRIAALQLAAAVLALLVASSPATFAVSSSYLTDAFARGEKLDFEIRWLKVVGGTATMTIGPLKSDPRRLRITSLAVSDSGFARFYPVRDEIESIVDRETFSTLRYFKSLRERKRRKEVTTIIDPERRIANRRGVDIALPPQVFDPLSIIYHLRSLDLEVGRTFSFSVLSDSKVYPLTATVLRRETIDTPAGRFTALVVQPQAARGGLYRAEGGEMIIWLSDDERRLPLRIRTSISAGTITATLKSAEVGGTLVAGQRAVSH